MRYHVSNTPSNIHLCTKLVNVIKHILTFLNTPLLTFFQALHSIRITSEEPSQLTTSLEPWLPGRKEREEVRGALTKAIGYFDGNDIGNMIAGLNSLKIEARYIEQALYRSILCQLSVLLYRSSKYIGFALWYVGIIIYDNERLATFRGLATRQIDDAYAGILSPRKGSYNLSIEITIFPLICHIKQNTYLVLSVSLIIYGNGQRHQCHAGRSW